MQQQLVVACGLGVARQRQMAPVGSRQMDIDHLHGGELLQDGPWRESRRARPGHVFQGDVQAVGDERDEDVRLDQAAGHQFRTSRTRSPTPCTGRSGDHRFSLAEVCESPRNHSRHPSAQALPGLRIAIVSRAHAPSIIAHWQGSGRRSDSGQHLRHDGDRRTA